MTIILDGSTGISSIGTLTGVTSISSAAANTAVVMQDSGSNSNTVRAWVNFNGTGTVAIRASFNVSSITDNGTGDYTVNFTTAMPDANYATVLGAQAILSTSFGVCPAIGYNTTPTTSAINITTNADNGTKYDLPIVNIAVFR
jgi:hypothetical protein